jgi:HK97 family phage major capsid protein
MPKTVKELFKRQAEIEQELDEMTNFGKNYDLSESKSKKYDDLTNEHKENRKKIEYKRAKGEIEDRSTFEHKEIEKMGTLRVFGPDEEFRSRNRKSEYQKKSIDFGQYLRGITLGDWGETRESRAMAKSSGANGGFLVPDQLADRLINKARKKNTATKAGAKIIEIPNGNLTLARVAERADAQIKAENAEAQGTTVGFDYVNVSLYTLFSLCTISQELLQDGQNIGEIVEKELTDSMSEKMDKLIYFGSGSGEPLGIANSKINEYSLGTDGSTLSNYNPWSHAVEKIRTSANIEPTHAIYNPRTAGSLDRLTATTNQPLEAPGSFKNLNKLITNQIGNDFTQGSNDNASVSIVGDFSNVLIGVHPSGMQIRATETGGGALEKYQYKISVALRFDALATIPDELAIIKGILPDA